MWQCAIWNTFGPIADTAKEVIDRLINAFLFTSRVFFKTFGWSDSTLVLFNLWGILAFFVFSPMTAYLLSKSLRYSALVASAAMFLGSTVRLNKVEEKV